MLIHLFLILVFKELLLKSAEIRMQPLADCDAMLRSCDVTDMSPNAEKDEVVCFSDVNFNETY